MYNRLLLASSLVAFVFLLLIAFLAITKALKTQNTSIVPQNWSEFRDLITEFRQSDTPTRWFIGLCIFLIPGEKLQKVLLKILLLVVGALITILGLPAAILGHKPSDNELRTLFLKIFDWLAKTIEGHPPPDTTSAILVHIGIRRARESASIHAR